MATPTLNPTPLDASAAPPAVDRKAKRPLKMFFMIAFSGIVLAFVLLKHHASFRVPRNPALYAHNYLAWRLFFADNEVFSEVYKYAKSNAYNKDDPEWAKYIEKAQGSEAVMMSAHADHFPRGQNKHYTLFSQPVETVAAILKDFAMDEARKMSVYPQYISGDKPIADKNSVVLGQNAKTRKEIIDTFSNRPQAAQMLIQTHDLLRRLYETKGSSTTPARPFITATVPSDIVELCSALLKTANIDKSNEYIVEQIRCIPQALAHMYTNYAISRMLVLVYLATLNCEVDCYAGKEKELVSLDVNSKEHKNLSSEIDNMKKDRHLRAKTIFAAVHYAISNAFEVGPMDYQNHLGFFDKTLFKTLGFKKLSEDRLRSLENNAKKVMDELLTITNELSTALRNRSV